MSNVINETLDSNDDRELPTERGPRGVDTSQVAQSPQIELTPDPVQPNLPNSDELNAQNQRSLEELNRFNQDPNNFQFRPVQKVEQQDFLPSSPSRDPETYGQAFTDEFQGIVDTTMSKSAPIPVYGPGTPQYDNYEGVRYAPSQFDTPVIYPEVTGRQDSGGVAGDTGNFYGPAFGEQANTFGPVGPVDTRNFDLAPTRNVNVATGALIGGFGLAGRVIRGVGRGFLGARRANRGGDEGSFLGNALLSGPGQLFTKRGRQAFREEFGAELSESDRFTREAIRQISPTQKPGQGGIGPFRSGGRDFGEFGSGPLGGLQYGADAIGNRIRAGALAASDSGVSPVEFLFTGGRLRSKEKQAELQRTVRLYQAQAGAGREFSPLNPDNPLHDWFFREGKDMNAFTPVRLAGALAFELVTGPDPLDALKAARRGVGALRGGSKTILDVTPPRVAKPYRTSKPTPQLPGGPSNTPAKLPPYAFPNSGTPLPKGKVGGNIVTFDMTPTDLRTYTGTGGLPRPVQRPDDFIDVTSRTVPSLPGRGTQRVLNPARTDIVLSDPNRAITTTGDLSVSVDDNYALRGIDQYPLKYATLDDVNRLALESGINPASLSAPGKLARLKKLNAPVSENLKRLSEGRAVSLAPILNLPSGPSPLDDSVRMLVEVPIRGTVDTSPGLPDPIRLELAPSPAQSDLDYLQGLDPNVRILDDLEPDLDSIVPTPNQTAKLGVDGASDLDVEQLDTNLAARMEEIRRLNRDFNNTARNAAPPASEQTIDVVGVPVEDAQLPGSVPANDLEMLQSLDGGVEVVDDVVEKLPRTPEQQTQLKQYAETFSLLMNKQGDESFEGSLPPSVLGVSSDEFSIGVRLEGLYNALETGTPFRNRGDYTELYGYLSNIDESSPVFTTVKEALESYDASPDELKLLKDWSRGKDDTVLNKVGLLEQTPPTESTNLSDLEYLQGLDKGVKVLDDTTLTVLEDLPESFDDLTLADLFAEADRIGAKYQDVDSGKVLDIESARKARDVLRESGFTDFIAANSSDTIRQIKTRGSIGVVRDTPGTVTQGNFPDKPVAPVVDIFTRMVRENMDDLGALDDIDLPKKILEHSISSGRITTLDTGALVSTDDLLEAARRQVGDLEIKSDIARQIPGGELRAKELDDIREAILNQEPGQPLRKLDPTDISVLTRSEVDRVVPPVTIKQITPSTPPDITVTALREKSLVDPTMDIKALDRGGVVPRSREQLQTLARYLGHVKPNEITGWTKLSELDAKYGLYNAYGPDINVEDLQRAMESGIRRIETVEANNLLNIPQQSVVVRTDPLVLKGKVTNAVMKEAAILGEKNVQLLTRGQYLPDDQFRKLTALWTNSRPWTGLRRNLNTIFGKGGYKMTPTQRGILDEMYGSLPPETKKKLPKALRSTLAKPFVSLDEIRARQVAPPPPQPSDLDVLQGLDDGVQVLDESDFQSDLDVLQGLDSGVQVLDEADFQSDLEFLQSLDPDVDVVDDALEDALLDSLGDSDMVEAATPQTRQLVSEKVALEETAMNVRQALVEAESNLDRVATQQLTIYEDLVALPQIEPRSIMDGTYEAGLVAQKVAPIAQRLDLPPQYIKAPSPGRMSVVPRESLSLDWYTGSPYLPEDVLELPLGSTQPLRGSHPPGFMVLSNDPKIAEGMALGRVHPNTPINDLPVTPGVAKVHPRGPITILDGDVPVPEGVEQYELSAAMLGEVSEENIDAAQSILDKMPLDKIPLGYIPQAIQNTWSRLFPDMPINDILVGEMTIGFREFVARKGDALLMNVLGGREVLLLPSPNDSLYLKTTRTALDVPVNPSTGALHTMYVDDALIPPNTPLGKVYATNNRNQHALELTQELSDEVESKTTLLNEVVEQLNQADDDIDRVLDTQRASMSAKKAVQSKRVVDSEFDTIDELSDPNCL